MPHPPAAYHTTIMYASICMFFPERLPQIIDVQHLVIMPVQLSREDVRMADIPRGNDMSSVTNNT